jgi:clan AA aspartic protease (TIGR02281 family)
MLSFRSLVSAMALTAMLGACASPEPPARPVAPPTQSKTLRVPVMTGHSGTPKVDVAIAGVCCFRFMVDSGASDVSVDVELFKAMINGGHVTKEDAIDVTKYKTANGVIEGLRFRMPPMTVNGHTVYGVVGSVHKGSDSMLLGQSFLKRFRFWAIDNGNSTLVLGI